MHISFNPALGTHTRVPVGSRSTNIKRDEDGVRAAFTAYVSPQDYAEAVRTGLRIEVWTNAPSGTRSAGEWGPIAFQEMDEMTIQPSVEETVPDLILSSQDRPSYPSLGETETSSRTHVFRAEFTIPHVPGWIFAFTYRLVYPSGICWLGSDRDNGVLELDERSPFFEEFGSWKTEGERRVHVDDSGPEYADADDGSVLGMLDVSEWTWAGWATDGSRVWSFGDTYLEQVDDAVLAYLIPTSSDTSLLLSRSYVFHARSREARFSITSQGQIITSKNPTIAYRQHESSSQSDLDLLRGEIESLCPAPHVFFTKDRDIFLFTPSHSSDSEVSVTVYAQRLTRSPAPSRPISLPIRAFDAFANFPDTISIFVPETRKSYFVNRAEGSGYLTLKYGSRGAEIVISAVYGIASSSAPPSDWQLSIPGCPAAPERVVLSANSENPLPTPPASPQSKPKPQRSVSFELPIENVAEGGLRRRKPVEPLALAPGRGTVARRLLRNDSAFERYQAAPLREKILVLAASGLKLLARFMGIAVLRFILFASRLLFGKTREPQTENNAEEERELASILPEDESGAQTIGAVATGSPDTTGAAGVENDTVEAPTHRSGGMYSTEGGPGSSDNQESSNPLSKSTMHGLKWVLPCGDEAPIRLLVRSDANPEELLEQLEIELNGGDIKHINSVYVVGEKTSLVEIARLEGGTTSELLVKVRG